MLKLLRNTGLVVLLIIFQNAFAQLSTEILIPLGQSPGLSGKYTALGTITSVNRQSKTLSMKDESRNYQVVVSDHTKVWLDRSRLKLSNTEASIADISEGMRVEVKYVKNEKNAAVEWIKVQAIE